MLSVEDLHVHFVTSRGVIRAVEGVSWRVYPGEMVALVGESGCGKSVSALAVMRLLAKPAGRVPRGRILFEGRDLLELPEDDMRAIRGRDISMIFQEPMTSLNPVLTIGLQIMEPLFIHKGMNEGEARGRAVELLRMVGISDAPRRLGQYPHQFSGGMRQRVMIAIGLACNPKLIIADEPTTALDVTIQAQILHLMKDLSRELDIAMVVITHNLGIVARYADRVNVMYAARTRRAGNGEKRVREAAASLHCRPAALGAETRPAARREARDDRGSSAQPAGAAGRLPLRAALPREGAGLRSRRCPSSRRSSLGITPPACARASSRSAARRPSASSRPRRRSRRRPSRSPAKPLLEVQGLKTWFDVSRGVLAGGRAILRAVDDVSFEIRAGETLGLVGESGCGKTTVGRTLLRLERETAGRIVYDGLDVTKAGAEEIKRYRRSIQVIFQDPYSSLNPRMTVGQIIAEPTLVHGLVADRAAAARRVSRAAGAGGPLRLHGRALSARALGRPAPAGRHRARARARAEVHRLRRAGVGAGRVDPGADHQSARGRCRKSSGSPIFSSPTISRWCATFRIGWW